MGVSLSISQLVVVMLCITAIIAGVVLLFKIGEMSSVLSYPMPEKGISVNVFPQSSQSGTLFLINAIYSNEKENRDLALMIKNGAQSEVVNLYDDGKHQDKKANDGFYGGFFDSSNKPAGIYNIENNNEILAFFNIYKSGCEVIEASSGKDTIDFVILPSGYNNYNEFKDDAKKIIDLKSSLLNVEPFVSNKNKFSFSVVNSTRNFNCEIGCKNVPTIVCCDNKAVFEEASRCHYDNVFVLVNNSDYCGSASSYAKICSKNPDSSSFLLHELGHSFADLADEYVYSDFFNYSVGDIDNANCDKEGCEKWKDITSECYKGCTYSNLYRPVEKNSAMLDLYPEYDVVSQNQISKIIENYTTEIKANEKALPYKRSYFIDLKYNSGDIKIDKVSLKDIKAGFYIRKSIYTIVLKDKKGINIFKGYLYIPYTIYPMNFSDKMIIEDSVEFPLTIPYSPNAKEIVIYKKDKPIANISVSEFSDVCGNGVCDSSENHVSCSVDCEIDKDNFCEKSSCDIDCASQKNCKITEKFKYWVVIGLMVLAFFVVLVILMRNRD